MWVHTKEINYKYINLSLCIEIHRVCWYFYVNIILKCFIYI